MAARAALTLGNIRIDGAQSRRDLVWRESRLFQPLRIARDRLDFDNVSGSNGEDRFGGRPVISPGNSLR